MNVAKRSPIVVLPTTVALMKKKARKTKKCDKHKKSSILEVLSLPSVPSCSELPIFSMGLTESVLSPMFSMKVIMIKTTKLKAINAAKMEHNNFPM